jgi:1,4-alpha-glucan branching enzyme
MWAHPGKKLIFMGAEFGQRREWADQRSLDWDESAGWGHRGVQLLIKDLNRVYRAHPALWRHDHDPSGFGWIDADDAGGNTYSFLRFDPATSVGSERRGPEDEPGRTVAVVINFSPEPRRDLRIGLPSEGRWREILNSDAELYNGTGRFGNLGQVVARPVPSHGYDYSAEVTVPPLGAVWFAYDPEHPVTDPAGVLGEITDAIGRDSSADSRDQDETAERAPTIQD